MELALRFLLGGIFVSLFAVLGDSFKPKSFAGIFGAAPSIALAGLTLSLAQHGVEYVRVDARSMIVGAAAMLIYGASCAGAVRRPHVRPWLAAGFLWAEWLLVAFLGYWLVRR